MPKTFDVSLPRNHRPLFPRTCIVCGCSSPKRRVKVSTADSWKSFLKRQSGTSKQQDRQFTANAPACGICAWRFRFIEWGGFAIAALIYGVAFYHFEGTLRQHVSKRGSALLLFVPTVPIIIAWMTVFRPPLSVSGTETAIQYTFTSEAFKDEFLSMNQIAEVPIDKIAQPDEDDPFKAMQL